MSILKNVQRFAELQQEKRELKDQISDVDQELKDLERHILDHFAESGVQSMKTDQGTVYMRRDLYASLDGDRGDAMEALVSEGLEDFIKTDFNLNQISAYVRELDREQETIGAPALPPTLSQHFKVTEKFSLRAVKK